MPFSGTIVTMHLKDKIGSFLNKGETLATVETVDRVKAEIEIPESDIPQVREKALVRIRPQVNEQRDLRGEVVSIDQTVTEQKYGRVVKVMTQIENPDEMLKTGMTGYAKIQSARIPLWRVLSMPLVRFAKVEIWSWLP